MLYVTYYDATDCSANFQKERSMSFSNTLRPMAKSNPPTMVREDDVKYRKQKSPEKRLVMNFINHICQVQPISGSKKAFFRECDVYWKPATDSTGLYEQLSQNKYREICRHHIQ